MSEYIVLGQTETDESICSPPCREGAFCVKGRCVRPATPPPPPSREEYPENDLVENGYEDDDLYTNGNGNGNGAGSNLFLYGGIFLALAAVAGGSYYYWFHVREQEEEE
jgi:hypothetical protein